jgi:hypothetical protein
VIQWDALEVDRSDASAFSSTSNFDNPTDGPILGGEELQPPATNLEQLKAEVLSRARNFCRKHDYENSHT